jgi:hypothetical protein
MAVSPRRTSLYRTAGCAVTLLAVVLTLAQVPLAQFIGKAKVSKGPRAIGLVEILPNGKARLIPIAIMVNGRFYDAGAYKAAPVPMALEQGTVYEAQRTGVSQGLFTVNLVGQTQNTWIAEGSWLPAGAKPARTAQKAETKPNMGDENDAPPTLRHGSTKSAPSVPNESKSPNTKPDQGAASTPGLSGSASPPATVSTSQSAASTGASPSTQETKASSADNASSSPNDDSDSGSGPRPTLKRGAQGSATQAEKIPVTGVSASANKASKATSMTAGGQSAATGGKSSSSENSGIKIYAAVSDNGGPELRPFAYEVKPDEEARFRKTMLDLAADEVRARARLISGSAQQATQQPVRPKAGAAHKPAVPKGPQPNFENVELRLFDMSNSNEPTLVLSASAHMPASSSTSSAASDVNYFVTVVGRWDINGDMHKIFAQTTDSHDLDAIARLELIDAVDADGDNRGDLLFRQVSDSGTSYVIYRVSPDKLWPLFNSGEPES